MSSGAVIFLLWILFTRLERSVTGVDVLNGFCVGMEWIIISVGTFSIPYLIFSVFAMFFLLYILAFISKPLLSTFPILSKVLWK